MRTHINSVGLTGLLKLLITFKKRNLFGTATAILVTAIS